MINRILQILVGATFTVSGIFKGIDPYGTALKVGEYLKAFTIGLSDSSSMALAVVLCGFEIFIGIMLMSFLYRKFFVILALVVLVLFSVMLLYFVVSPSYVIEDCGCFGDIIHMSLSVSIAKNILLIGVVMVILHLINEGSVQYKLRKCVTYISSVMALSMSIPVYSAVWLPFIEFTEYRIGADLHNVKSFQLVNGENENVTHKVLNTDQQILIVAKRGFSVSESNIVKTLIQSGSNGQYNIDVITSGSVDNWKNELYCSDNTLKMIVRTPENAVIYLEKGIIKKKAKLGNLNI